MEEWTPGRREIGIMQVLSVVAVLAGAVGYGVVHLLGSPRPPSFTIGPVEMLVGLALVVAGLAVVVVAHEGVHGLAMLPFGARPRFGFTRMGGSVPAFFCTADGHRFTQPQYAWIALAPTVVLGLGLAVLVAQPWAGAWLVVVAAFHLSGCVGDWVMAAVAGRRPAGTLVEDLQTGMRFHAPAHS